MKKNLHLFAIIFIITFFSNNLIGQESTSGRGSVVQSEIKDTRKLELNNLLISSIYSKLEREILTTGKTQTLLLNDLDIQTYIELFENGSNDKVLDRASAVERIESIVGNAKDKLEIVHHARNITLIESDCFYGDDKKISKIISYKIDIVDKNDKAHLYEVLFVEIHGVYKVLAVN